MLIDENKLRHDSLYNCGRKHGFAKALNLFRIHPAERAIEMIQEELERCEDKEIAIDRQLENILPMHSCI